MAHIPLTENLAQELRRGSLVLAVLALLQEEQYGYSALKLLADRGLDVDQGTLYPLLRRLETQGLLESRWRLDGSRPRRYYAINAEGRRVFAELCQEWRRLAAALDALLVPSGCEPVE
jgi:DNA-binding PadR family transcriptional regulator